MRPLHEIREDGLSVVSPVEIVMIILHLDSIMDERITVVVIVVNADERMLHEVGRRLLIVWRVYTLHILAYHVDILLILCPRMLLLIHTLLVGRVATLLLRRVISSFLEFWEILWL